MTKKMFVLAIAASLLILAGMAVAADMVRMKPIPPRQAILTGDEPMPDVPYYPSSSTILTNEQAGTTQYDYQSNGSTGRRIVIDNQGNIHVAWMKGMPYPSTRHIYFNCKTSTGWTSPETGSQANFGVSGSGYTQIDATTDDRSTITYHRAPVGSESLFVAIDAFTCLASFEYKRPPSRNAGQAFLWPYIAVDNQNRIHVVASHNAATGAPQPFMYTRSTDVGQTWSTLQRVDTLEVISPIVVASRVSDRVAIVYNHATDTASQWKNNVYYIQSTDGVTWDWRNGKVNVTHYGQGGDSLFAYTDVSALYDYNDNLHLLWNAQYVTTGIYYSSQLLHFDSNSGTVHQIAQFDSTWPSAGCEFGAWNWGFAKMSLAVDVSQQSLRGLHQLGYIRLLRRRLRQRRYLPELLHRRRRYLVRQNQHDQYPDTGCAPGDCDSDHWS